MYADNNLEKCRENNKRWYKENKERKIKQSLKYNKNNPEKVHKALAKYHAKEKGYGFNLIKPNIINEQVAYHHVNKNDVIAIPYDIHQLYIFGMENNKHRFMCKQIIKQIYGSE